MDTSPSRKTLIEALSEYAEEVDDVPTVRGMRENGEYSPYYYKQEFGTWHDALRAAGIQPTHGINPDVGRTELLNELQKVNDQIDRSPRRRDVDEYGKYDSNVYHEEFDSFINALEEAGITPDERQYRFSNVETPENLQGSENIEILKENGPTPGSELPRGISTKDRERGVWKFHLDSGSTNPSVPVYYLADEHAPGLVIRRFFKYNPHVLEHRYPHGLKIDIRNHQDSWKDIGRELVDKFVEEGVSISEDLESLAIIQLDGNEIFQFCFEQSVNPPVDTNQLLKNGRYGTRPVWGFSKGYREKWESITKGDGLLFSRTPGVFTHYVPVLETIEDNGIMTELWVEYENGIRKSGISEPWPLVVIGREVIEIEVAASELPVGLGEEIPDRPIHFAADSEIDDILNRYGGFEEFLKYRNKSSNPWNSIELSEATEEDELANWLLNIDLEDGSVAELESELQEVSRKVRKDAFREGIKDIYPGCAACGKTMEAPDGSIDIEAAHILPKAQDGPDLLQNGIALCSRHHWGYDHGWFEIDADYRIQVADCPELGGYSEFYSFDGEQLWLPAQESHKPHPKYLNLRQESNQ